MYLILRIICSLSIGYFGTRGVITFFHKDLDINIYLSIAITIVVCVVVIFGMSPFVSRMIDKETSN